jgi:hypothetical protein
MMKIIEREELSSLRMQGTTNSECSCVILVVLIAFGSGQSIPRVKYSKAEIETWSTIWDHLRPLQKKHALSVYNKIFPLLEQNCGYAKDSIPQLQDISDFLKGWCALYCLLTETSPLRLHWIYYQTCCWAVVCT